MKYKHSAVDLTDLAIGIVVLGVVVTIGATVLINLRNNTYDSSTLLTQSWETVGNLSTPQTLDNSWASALTACTAGNSTDPSILANVSLSTNLETGVGTVTGTGTALGQVANCSYTYYDVANNPSYTVADSASTGLAEYGNWFDIIVIVGVAAVILSLIFLAFGRNSTLM